MGLARRKVNNADIELKRADKPVYEDDKNGVIPKMLAQYSIMDMRILEGGDYKNTFTYIGEIVSV